MEVVGLIGAVGTLAETFGQGLKKLRKSYKIVKTFEVTVDDDLLNANVQATKLQIWGENLDGASVSPDALQLFPTIIDRAQEHIGEIAEVLGRYTSDVGDKGSNDRPKDIKSIVKGLSKLELKTKIKFATADHKR